MPNKENPTQKPDPEWLEHTACKQTDAPLFFHAKNQEQIDERNALCTRCEVKKECLEDAMYYGDVAVFRAGKKPYELRKELKRRGGRKQGRRRKRLRE